MANQEAVRSPHPNPLPEGEGTGALDLTFVDETVARLGRRPEAVIAILQAIQGHYRYLPPAALRRVAELTEITAATIAGVSTFYSQFRHQPVGRHTIRVCHGTACHVKGAQVVHDAFQRRLKIAPGDDTDAEGLFTVEKVVCLGCCTLAPVVQIDGVTYGGDDFPSRGRGAGRFSRPASGAARRRPGAGGARPASRWARSASAWARAASPREAARSTRPSSGRLPPAAPRPCSRRWAAWACAIKCRWSSWSLPPARRGCSPRSRPRAPPAIVHSQFKPKGVARRIGYALSRWLDRFAERRGGRSGRGPRPGGARRAGVRLPGPAAPRGHRVLRPVDARPTWTSIFATRGSRPCGIASSGSRPRRSSSRPRPAGLRGRGGAGFPTGLKWAAVRNAPGGKKYVLCNGDEGDPGAFMDRMLLESFPYRIIEGMAIAARAVGADEGIFYIRAEYPLAVKRIDEALEQCRQRGLLGEGILGSDFCLDIDGPPGGGGLRLRRGDGAAGRPGGPPRHAPAASALSGRVRPVGQTDRREQRRDLRPGPLDLSPRRRGIRRTGHRREQGHQGLRPGRQGPPRRPDRSAHGRDHPADRRGDRRRLRWREDASRPCRSAGPPAAACPPSWPTRRWITRPWPQLGAIMGSGGLVVLDEDDCMVDIARFFLAFTQQQSCGKCAFCRVGTRRMLDILDRICERRRQGRRPGAA